ncbi:MAG: NADH dehydrogenase (Quinone), chain G, partial [Leptospirillum sp. Group IV 'UBA BS']
GKTGEILLSVLKSQPPHKAHRESVVSRVREWKKQNMSDPIPGVPVPILEEEAFVLQLSKSINHSGTFTTRDSSLMTIEGEGLLRVPRQWARKRKIKKGTCVLVRSAHGEVSLPVDPVAGLSEREVHFPLHFADERIRSLFGRGFSWNQRSGVPSGQSISVTLEPVV